MPISRADAVARMNMGKEVEVMLEPRWERGHLVLRYATVRRSLDSFVASVWEVFDDGRPDFWDIYAFERLDPDNAPIGGEFNSFACLCGWLTDQHGLGENEFVGSGMLQQTYRDRFHPEW